MASRPYLDLVTITLKTNVDLFERLSSKQDGDKTTAFVYLRQNFYDRNQDLSNIVEFFQLYSISWK